MKKALVAYFSASGVTAGLAKTLCGVVNGDLYEIKPARRIPRRISTGTTRPAAAPSR